MEVAMVSKIHFTIISQSLK